MRDEHKNNSQETDAKNTTRREVLGTITHISVASLVTLVAPRIKAVTSPCISRSETFSRVSSAAAP